MFRILCLAAALIAGSLSCALADTSTPATVVNYSEAATVIIFGDEGTASDFGGAVERGFPMCSGFYVGRRGTDDLVITAGHCVGSNEGRDTHSRTIEDAKPMFVQYFDGERSAVTKAVKARDEDLALLVTHNVRHHRAATFAQQLVRGQRLWVFGSPDRLPWTLLPALDTQGSLPLRSSLHPYPRIWRDGYLITCVGCLGGISGAGVWDAQGHVVGVLVAGISSLAAMIPSRYVRELIHGTLPQTPITHVLFDDPNFPGDAGGE